MTPAERDEVRGLAKGHLAYHLGGLEHCTDCRNGRAVLRYVPPGDATDMEIGVDRDSVVVDIREGSAYSPAGARTLAHALHAAADAAEEA